MNPTQDDKKDAGCERLSISLPHLMAAWVRAEAQKDMTSTSAIIQREIRKAMREQEGVAPC